MNINLPSAVEADKNFTSQLHVKLILLTILTEQENKNEHEDIISNIQNAPSPKDKGIFSNEGDEET